MAVVLRLLLRPLVQPFTNVGLALSFNGVGVLAAISGLVYPVWAMIAMAASVSVVLTNSFAGRLLPKGHANREAEAERR